MDAFRAATRGHWQSIAMVGVLVAILGLASAGTWLGGPPSQILSNVGRAVGPSSERDAAVGDATVGAAGSGAKPAPVATPGAPATGAKDDAKIVRTGQVTLEVEDVDRAIDRLAATIRGLGGYVGASDRRVDGDRPVATVTYRVPIERWDDALVAIRATGTRVVAEQSSAIEVTAQVVDLEARLRNLRATESALQAIMAKAQKIPDILEVQAQLTDVRSQIEQLVAQRDGLVDQATLATIKVSLSTPVAAVAEVTRTWAPAAEVDRAVAQLVDNAQAVAGAGIWFGIVWLPILLVLGAVALVVLFVLRRLGVVGRRVEAVPDQAAA